MDSLTQAALGAAVGYAVMGRQIGPKAMLWGAVIATVPDLDVFVPLGSDVDDFTKHRSASHSLPPSSSRVSPRSTTARFAAVKWETAWRSQSSSSPTIAIVGVG